MSVGRTYSIAPAPSAGWLFTLVPVDHSMFGYLFGCSVSVLRCKTVTVFE